MCMEPILSFPGMVEMSRYVRTKSGSSLRNDRMKVGDETAATQLVKIENTVGWNASNTTIISAWRNLRLNFHNRRYCHIIRETTVK